MERGRAYFVSGIDTDAGKSCATGYIASRLIAKGFSVITQKMVQTGCGDNCGEVSEDILVHRKIMGTVLLPEDLDGMTCSQKFPYPASVDLAARLAGTVVDLEEIAQNTAKLLSKYDIVLIEGAGGLMVPLKGHYTIIDYLAEKGLPLILVTNPKLGSVNHTLLSLEACKNSGIKVDTVLYNLFPETSDIITADTRRFLRDYLTLHFPGTRFAEVPFIASCSQ